jgi:prepilin-type processing-associated H-X9-DG protein
MYATDYDERIGPAATWPQGTEPYVRNRDLFLCPADAPGSIQSPWPLSYGMDQALTGRRLGDVPVPAEAPSLMDATSIMGDPARMIEFRHEGAAVVSFVDGHVRALEESDWREWEGLRGE